MADRSIASLFALVLLGCGAAAPPTETPEPPPRISRTDPGAVSALSLPLPPATYRATDLAIGAAHACALVRGGGVECWGANGSGELGDGTSVSRAAPAPVTGLAPVVEITAGMAHTCARTSEGHVYCWGDGELGEIGDGALGPHVHPTPVVLGSPALAIASAGAMTCARIDAEGTLRCWGSFPSPDPAAGETSLTHTEPTTMTIASRDPPELASDTLRTCALDREGRTWCWGISDAVGLDLPAMIAPALVPSLGPATDLTQGGSFVCAALVTGVSCWGSGAGPVLGIAAESPTTPAPIARMRGEARIAAGQSFVCGATSEATRCAGYGELVDPDGGLWPLGGAARVIPLLAGARRLVAGGSLVCAIVDDDAVRCMGHRTGATHMSPPS